MARTAPRRIVLNCLLDAVLAALALPAALWLAAPLAAPPGLWWLLALPLASASLLLAGWPLGLPRQYWRFAGLPDGLAVAGPRGWGRWHSGPRCCRPAPGCRRIPASS